MCFRLFTVGAALALGAGVAAAAVGSAGRPVKTTSAGTTVHAKVFVVPTASQTLYDQNTNDSGVGISSQDFESQYDLYDDAGADDFTVPANTAWRVKEVDITGVYYNGSGPAASENVVFYKTRGTLPRIGVKNGLFTGLAGADNGTGSFVIALPDKGLKLKGGAAGTTYWVSVQVNMDLGAGGQWGWETSSVQNGNGAVWQNPGNGFGTGCTKWDRLKTCIAAGEGPDFMFAVKGTHSP